jgi:hypothetical protein
VDAGSPIFFLDLFAVGVAVRGGFDDGDADSWYLLGEY